MNINKQILNLLIRMNKTPKIYLTKQQQIVIFKLKHMMITVFIYAHRNQEYFVYIFLDAVIFYFLLFIKY